jgi:hypothetical protein
MTFWIVIHLMAWVIARSTIKNSSQNIAIFKKLLPPIHQEVPEE